MNAVEMFVRCRDHQAWSDLTSEQDVQRETDIQKEIGRTLRAGGLGLIRPAEVPDSTPVTLPTEAMGNGESGVPMEAMWA